MKKLLVHYKNGASESMLNALNTWKINIFKIIDSRISFYCNYLHFLPPKFTFRNLKKRVQEFQRMFVLGPADKAADNVVVL